MAIALPLSLENYTRRNATKKLLEGETRVSQNKAFVSIRQITVKIMPRA